MNKLFVVFLCVFIFLIYGCTDGGPDAFGTVSEQLESCKKDLSNKNQLLGEYKWRVDGDKKQVTASYESEVEGPLKLKFTLYAIAFSILFCALSGFALFLYFKSHYAVKEKELISKIELKESDLNHKESDLTAKIAEIESQKAEMLKQIYIRDIYGKKLNEAITFLKNELNSNIDHTL